MSNTTLQTPAFGIDPSDVWPNLRNLPQNSLANVNDPVQLLKIIAQNSQNASSVTEQSIRIGRRTSQLVSGVYVPGWVLAQIDVPFAFNSIVLSVYGGLVNAAYGQKSTTPTAGASITTGTLPATEDYDWMFGAYAFVPTDSNPNTQNTPIILNIGQQEIRFPILPPGRVTFWTSPYNVNPVDSSILGPVEIVGAIQRIP